MHNTVYNDNQCIGYNKNKTVHIREEKYVLKKWENLKMWILSFYIFFILVQTEENVHSYIFHYK